jgi:predicted Zn-dependent peptidase
MFKKIVLDNGLRIITAPMQGTNTVTVLILCGTGSDYESKENNGISHFLEHMFFKGTKKRPRPEVVNEEMDGMGAIHNAFTSHELTGYFLKVGKDYLLNSLDILADIYKNSLLEEEEIEKEKQVIVEEMHLDHDNPTIHIWRLWEHLLYGDQPAGWDISGEEKIIRALKRDDFANYFHNQYVSENTAVVVAGNFEEGSTISLIESLFGDIRRGPPLRQKPPIKKVQPASPVEVEYREIDQTNLMLGFSGYDAKHPRRYAADVLGVLLGGGASSRMFREIRGRLGLAYYVTSVHESYSNRGYLITYAGVDHSNVEKTIRVALEEYKKMCEKAVSAKELRRVKDYIRGTTLIGLEQSNAVASFVGTEEMISGKPLTVDEVFAKIESVTTDDIKAVAQDIFRPELLNLAMIGPFKEKEKFAKLLKDFKL